MGGNYGCDTKEYGKVIAKIEKHQVMGALKATGSFDLDILFARKDELLAETRRKKLLGVGPIVLGVLMCVTVIGAVVGIPAILFGWRMEKRIRANIANVERAFAEYLAGLVPRARTSAR